jgi:hypothetical protein
MNVNMKTLAVVSLSFESCRRPIRQEIAVGLALFSFRKKSVAT